MKNFCKIFIYFKFLFTSFSKKGFGIHSPFIYNFVNEIINKKIEAKDLNKIENLRTKLLKTKEVIEVEDFGAGSKLMTSNFRKISDIVRFSATNKKYGELIYKIIKYFEPKNIIELGTSLGIGTLYMALANKNSIIHTIEGSKNVCEFAQKNIKEFDCKNIIFYNNKFDDILPSILKQMQTVDLIFIDGNHQKEATLKYFEIIVPFCNNETILIFDDISWSKDMQTAWQTIICDDRVVASIDLFFWGIVFFRKEMKQQCFKIRN